MAIEDFDQVTIAPAKLRPFSKFIMSIGELPTSYLDSLSYAEQVTWFCDYLQNNVIPTINNNATALEDLINYIKNLDLQDEVNNKLDEMADSGELLQLIGDYIDFVTPEMFGAKGDGITDDTEAFQAMINSGYYFVAHSDPSKVYLISEKLHLQAYQQLDLNGATLKCNSNSLDYLIEIDTSFYKGGILKNIKLDCNNQCGGIYVKYGTVYNLENVHIKNVLTNGIYIYQGNVNANNINIENTSCYNGSIGIYTQGTDSKSTNVIIKDLKTGIYNNNGINYYNMCHVWLSNNINNSIGFYIHGGASLDNCYIDTYNTAIINDNGQLLLVNNLRVFINSTIYNGNATNAPVFIEFTQAINNIILYPTGAFQTYLYSFNLQMTSDFDPIFSSCNYNDIMRYLPLKKIAQNKSPFNLVNYYETELTDLSADFNVSVNKIREYDDFFNINLVMALASASSATANTPKTFGKFPTEIKGIQDTFIKTYCGNATGVDHGNTNIRFIKTGNSNGVDVIYVDTPNTYYLRLNTIIPKII